MPATPPRSCLARTPRRWLIPLALTLACLAASGVAQEAEREIAVLDPTKPQRALSLADGSVRPAELELPESFRDPLRREMQALEEAGAELLRQLVRGEAAEAAATARRIDLGFVLGRELSPDDQWIFESLQPASYRDQDAAFRARTRRLIEALERGDLAGAVPLYAGMVQACIACHALHAREALPGFARDSGAAGTGNDERPAAERSPPWTSKP